MEKNSHCSTSSSGGKYSEATDSTDFLGNCDSEDGICASLSNTLQIKAVDRTSYSNDLQKSPGQGCYTEEEEEEEEEEDFTEDQLLSQMGYAKSETKRDAGKKPEWQDQDEEEEEEEDEDDLLEGGLLSQMDYLKNEPVKHEPITTPLAELNLVSALKGSREKEGNPSKDRQVSWSPNVYDPSPTSSENLSLSNSMKNKDPMKVKGLVGRNRQKATGKGLGVIDDGGSKGKRSRGGGGKASPAAGGKAAGKDKKKIDKKQAKKRGDRGSKFSEY